MTGGWIIPSIFITCCTRCVPVVHMEAWHKRRCGLHRTVFMAAFRVSCGALFQTSACPQDALERKVFDADPDPPPPPPPHTPKTVQSAEGEEGKEERERIIVVVRSLCQENYPADAHPSAHKSVLESANPAWTRSVHLDAPGQRHEQQPVSGTADPGVVKQDKSSRGSFDTTKTRSGPQRVRMSSGERPIEAAKGKQSDTEALCQSPPLPPIPRPCANPPPPFSSSSQTGQVIQGSVDITKTGPGPQRVRMSSGERLIGGKQSDTSPPPFPVPQELETAISRAFWRQVGMSQGPVVVPRISALALPCSQGRGSPLPSPPLPSPLAPSPPLAS